MDEKEKRKLMIVDNEVGLCEIFQSHFQKKGYVVKFATSAEAALSLIKENNFQIMVVDKRMPGLSGIELVRQVRQFNQELRVIMLSADTLDTEMEEEMQRLDILAYLEKPIPLPALDAALEKAVSRR